MAYSDVKSAIDSLFFNNVTPEIRGNPSNNVFTIMSLYSRDFLGDRILDQTGLVDECLIVYDQVSNTYIVKPVQWITVADIAAFNALVLGNDYNSMDYIEILENGFGQVEIKRYIGGVMRTISKYVDQS